jgi:hypothetical protein
VILTIPSVPPSLNRTRVHWSKLHRLKNEWIQLLRSVYVPNGKATTKKKVTITLHHSREYDRDNLFGSVKPLVDAMRTWDILVNDTSEWLDLEVKQAKCPHKQRHTTIQVEEV